MIFDAPNSTRKEERQSPGKATSKRILSVCGTEKKRKGSEDAKLEHKEEEAAQNTENPDIPTRHHTHGRISQAKNPALFPESCNTCCSQKKYPGPTLYLCCSSSGRVSVSHVICAQTINHKQRRKGGSSGDDDNLENRNNEMQREKQPLQTPVTPTPLEVSLHIDTNVECQKKKKKYSKGANGNDGNDLFPWEPRKQCNEKIPTKNNGSPHR